MSEEENIKKGLEEINQIINMAIAQKKLLTEMLHGKRDEMMPTTVAQKIRDAIDDFIADKPISYKLTEGSSETRMELKFIDMEANSSAIVTITDLDWI